MQDVCRIVAGLLLFTLQDSYVKVGIVEQKLDRAITILVVMAIFFGLFVAFLQNKIPKMQRKMLTFSKKAL